VLAETAGAPRDLLLGEPLPDLIHGLAPRFRPSFCWVRVRYGLCPSLDKASAEIPGHRFLKADYTRSDAAGDAAERDVAEHRTLWASARFFAFGQRAGRSTSACPQDETDSRRSVSAPPDRCVSKGALLSHA
jgi:hypothetical protein